MNTYELEHEHELCSGFIFFRFIAITGSSLQGLSVLNTCSNININRSGISAVTKLWTCLRSEYTIT